MKFRAKVISIVLSLILIVGLLLGSYSVSASEQEQPTFATPILVVNASFLNIRSGPGVGYTIIATVVGGTELPVLGVARDRVWYQVATDIGPGWVNVEFTLPRGDFRHVPFVDPGEAVQQGVDLGSGGGAVPVNTQQGQAPTGDRALRPWGVSVLGGDLRNAPSDFAGVIRAAVGPRLDQVYPLVDQTFAEGRLWFRAVVPGLGAVWNEAHQFVLRPMQCSPNQSVVVVIRSTGLGGGPDGTVAPGFGLVAGQEAYVIDVREGLAKLELIDGTVGWVDIEATQGRPDTVLSFCDGVNAGFGNVSSASGSTTSSSTITGATTLPPPAIVGPRVVVNTGNLNIRSGPSAGFSVVATVPGGIELAVIGVAPDGVWFWVEGTFGRGWVNNQFTLFRGDINRVPVIDFRNIGSG